MFSKVKEFFKGEHDSLVVDEGGNPTEGDLIVAVAVLLFEMAGADSGIAHEEAQTICDAMQTQFGLEEEQIPELMAIAVAARQEVSKIDKFVKLINDNFNEAQRQKILAMIWAVVRADGTVDKFEERFATQMKFRLKLSDELAEQAKQMSA